MTAYVARFMPSMEIVVQVDAEDEDDAAEAAWKRAEEYAQTVFGDGQGVEANVSLDGIGAYQVEEGTL